MGKRIDQTERDYPTLIITPQAAKPFNQPKTTPTRRWSQRG